MTELGKKVKEDSERLAEQARALRTAQQMHALNSGGGATTPSAMTSSFTSHHAGSSSRQTPVASRGARAFATTTSSSSNLSPSQTFAEEASAAAAASISAFEAPSELFQPDVIALLDEHKRALVALWTHYSASSRAKGDAQGPNGAPYGCAEGLDAKRFVTLFADFDIAPTFLTKRELKFLFSAAALAAGEIAGADGHAGADARMGYPAFVEALGRTALVALSKPTFEHLYPSPKDKLACLLITWGVADARKLGDIKARAPRGASSVATGTTRGSTNWRI